MELNEAFRILEKTLSDINSELGFAKVSDYGNSITFNGEKGAYRVVYDEESTIMAFECADDYADNAEFKTISRSLFDISSYGERDVKSLGNEVADELSGLFKTKKKVDLDKVKMPKAVSRTKAKNGMVSYDTDSLANRFGTLYPELKDCIKENIVKYGEFLPETFFIEHGTAKVISVIESGNDAECKRLFKMLNEVYEDGTNEVQDIIGVTILGEMKNDKRLMETADKYMSEYMAGPIHEINKLTRKQSSLTKKLANPPAYKPKKKNNTPLQSVLQNPGGMN